MLFQCRKQSWLISAQILHQSFSLNQFDNLFSERRCHVRLRQTQSRTSTDLQVHPDAVQCRSINCRMCHHHLGLPRKVNQQSTADVAVLSALWLEFWLWRWLFIIILIFSFVQSFIRGLSYILFGKRYISEWTVLNLHHHLQFLCQTQTASLVPYCPFFILESQKCSGGQWTTASFDSPPEGSA